VDLIAGPGGVCVAEAKRQLAGVVGTDLPAGPSEVLIVADETASADLVYADLCAQAEHDPAARPLLVSTSLPVLDAVEKRVAQGFADRPNRDALEGAFARSGLLVHAASLVEAAAVADLLAPEHLEVMVADPDAFLARVRHFGAAFLGPHSAEVFGDYGAGPNHVLPTGGAARFTAGLSVYTFLRCQTTLRLDARAARALAPGTAALATAEGLAAHAAAARLRQEHRIADPPP
jgi:histidinol dehydrogenase